MGHRCWLLVAAIIICVLAFASRPVVGGSPRGQSPVPQRNGHATATDSAPVARSVVMAEKSIRAF